MSLLFSSPVYIFFTPPHSHYNYYNNTETPHKMDSFITAATHLLEAFPNATVSIAYSNVHKKTGVDSRRPANKVRFKVYDAELSKCVRYSTTKSKELSKLLSFLGPHGVSTGTKRKAEGDEPTRKSAGLAAIMSNTKIEELPSVPEEVEVKVEEPKKKKKKGKKK